MLEMPQELMTPREAARWFRRSPSWLRQQPQLLRLGVGGQPLYHVRVCRAYVIGRLCGLGEAELRRMQVEALAQACGLSDKSVQALLEQHTLTPAPRPDRDENRAA